MISSGDLAFESKVAELADGTLVQNARHTPQRVRAFSKDGGRTWTPQEVDRDLSAVSCNGSLLCVKNKAGRDVLLCAAPAGPKRTYGTIYLEDLSSGERR